MSYSSELPDLTYPPWGFNECDNDINSDNSNINYLDNINNDKSNGNKII